MVAAAVWDGLLHSRGEALREARERQACRRPQTAPGRRRKPQTECREGPLAATVAVSERPMQQRVALGDVTQALFDASTKVVEASTEGRELAHEPLPSLDGHRCDDADSSRHAGNRLYKLGSYEEAAAAYTQGLAVDPRDHRLWCCRAQCRAALRDWPKCWGDAQHATQLEPEYVKGWQLLAKALWKDGMPVMAKQVLADALRVIPGSQELLELNSQIDRCRGRSSAAAASAAPVTPTKPRAKRPVLVSPRAASAATGGGRCSLGNSSKPSSPAAAECARMGASIERCLSVSPVDTPAGGSTTSTTPGSSSARSSPCPTPATNTSGRCFPRPPRPPPEPSARAAYAGA